MNEKKKPTSTNKIYLEHARREDQLADMENIAERDICFMCQENIPEFYEQRGGLIDEGQYTFLVLNGYPYENTRHHYMVIPKEHITSLEELNDETLLEMLSFYRKLEKELEITGGAIAMRFGNPAETGATVHHLHMHLIVPSEDLGPGDKPVRFRISRSFK